MKKRKLVDPVHFFNSECVPLLNVKQLQDRCALLEHQVERLKRVLRARIMRDQTTAKEKPPTILH